MPCRPLVQGAALNESDHLPFEYLEAPSRFRLVRRH